eukprot:398569-Pyramimonas_sp.AAC.1
MFTGGQKSATGENSLLSPYDAVEPPENLIRPPIICGRRMSVSSPAVCPRARRASHAGYL